MGRNCFDEEVDGAVVGKEEQCMIRNDNDDLLAKDDVHQNISYSSKAGCL